MTDDELVKKLRNRYTPDITPANLERAADAIERLTEANQAQTNISRALQGEVERLRAELAAAVARAEELQAELMRTIADEESGWVKGSDYDAAVARAEKAEAVLNWLIAVIVVPLAASFDEDPDDAEVLRSAAYRYAREWWAENRYRWGEPAAAAESEKP